MTLYEIIAALCGVGISCLTAAWGYHRWIMSYIDDKDTSANKEILNTLKEIKTAQESMTEKFNKINERVIILDNTAVREGRVRELLDEYRMDSKQDNIEIKTILKTIIDNVEALKTEAAINKALNKRSDR